MGNHGILRDVGETTNLFRRKEQHFNSRSRGGSTQRWDKHRSIGQFSEL